MHYILFPFLWLWSNLFAFAVGCVAWHFLGGRVLGYAKKIHDAIVG